MKRVKRYLLVLVCILLMSGCVKNETTMKINKDKTMNLEISFLIKDEYKNNLSSKFNPSDIEKRGFKVTTINNEESYNGYKVTKKFDNIDELSKGTKEPLEITNILDEDFDFTKLFVKESSFFKETYTANYKYSVSSLQTKYSFGNEDGTLYDEDNEEEVSNMVELELTYTSILPSSAKSHNSLETSEGGKKLVWRLSTKEDNKISYSFTILNMSHILMVAGGGLLLLIIIIVLIVLIKRKKESTSSLIYKEYDPSIEGQLNKNEIIKEEDKKEETPAQVEAPVQAKTTTVEATPQEPVVETPQVPVVETAVSSSPTKLDSLEFNLPEEETHNYVEVKEKENQFVGTKNDFNIPEVITPQETPGAVQKPEVQANTFDYNRRPDFVRQNEASRFINEQPQNVVEKAPEGGINTPSIDIPNATALSDMPDYK